MSWLRRTPRPPVRVPHKDKKVDLELQQILTLQARVARAETSITDYQDEVAELLLASRTLSGMVSEPADVYARCVQQISLNDERTAWLMAEMRTLEDAIVQAQELIRAIKKDLTSEDLEHL